MDDDRFHHHPYLQTVAGEDVRAVTEKDLSYGASWKKRGGVGAFMMLARKWDRLETMISQVGRFGGGEKDAPSYDIFRWMECEKESGDKDGTVLAEIRDLRRYLLLVEAEMMARSAVESPSQETARSFDMATVHIDGVGKVDVPKKNFRNPDGSPFYQSEPRFARPGTPEDGGHHARQGNGRLDDGVLIRDIPEGTSYISFDAYSAIIDRRHTPEDQWDHLPRLALELNDKEHEELPEWYQRLYRWREIHHKWVMEPTYHEHWGRQ